MSITQMDLARIQRGKPKAGDATEDELTWLRIFDGLYSEEAEELDRYQDYYDGEQSIVWSSDKFKKIFGNDFESFRDNWCETVVDTVAERLSLNGFVATRIEQEDPGTEDTDSDATPSSPASNGSKPVPPPKPAPEVKPEDPGLRSGLDPITGEQRAPGEKKVDPQLERLRRKASAIYKRNRVDTIQDLIHTMALVKGKSYLICWPDAKGFARFYVNDASLMRCWYDENDELECAAKQWRRPDGSTRRNLYFADRVEKWILTAMQGNLDPVEAQKRVVGTTASAQAWAWERFQDEDDDAWPLNNPYNRPPVFPFLNKPHNAGEGTSEIKNVIPQQDAINKTLADMMVAGEHGAFMQKVMASKGRPKEGWKHGPNQLWSTTDTDAKWGQFDATPLSNFVEGVTLWVEHVAATSRTPMHSFMQKADPPSGEALKTAESGLVGKSNKKIKFFGNSWEDATRMAIEIEMGEDFPDDVTLTSQWDSPETRNEKEFWEIAAKKIDAGIPEEVIWEEAGYDQEEIDRFKEVREAKKQEMEDEGLMRALQSGLTDNSKMEPIGGAKPPPPPGR